MNSFCGFVADAVCTSAGYIYRSLLMDFKTPAGDSARPTLSVCVYHQTVTFRVQVGQMSGTVSSYIL